MPRRAVHQAHDLERLVGGDGQSPVAGTVAEAPGQPLGLVSGLEVLRVEVRRLMRIQGELDGTPRYSPVSSTA